MLSRQQHGFVLVTRLIHNCSIRVMIGLCSYLIEKKLTLLVWILLKAFYSVVHDNLIFKLSAYGFEGLLYSWIHDFLPNRYQCFEVWNCLFTVCNIIIGVPRGSFVGILLFIIYINDPSDVTNNYQNTVTFKLFADDVNF